MQYLKVLLWQTRSCCVQAVKAPHNYFACLQKHVRTYYAMHVVQACADVTCYALWAGMCASHVLCKLLCGNCHGSGVQKWEYGMDDSEMLLISIQKCISSYRDVHPTVEI